MIEPTILLCQTKWLIFGLAQLGFQKGVSLMAFTNTRGRYASFGAITSLPDDVIDTFWYIIDNFLKDVFPLNNLIRFELINNKGKLTFRFSEDHLDTLISFDFTYKFDPFYPRMIYVVDNDGRETVMLADEYSMF